MIRDKSNFVQKLDNLCCNKTIPNKMQTLSPNCSVHDLESAEEIRCVFDDIFDDN